MRGRGLTESSLGFCYVKSWDVFYKIRYRLWVVTLLGPVLVIQNGRHLALHPTCTSMGQKSAIIEISMPLNTKTKTNP